MAEQLSPRGGRVGLVTSAEYLQHDTGNHPENAGRLRAVYQYLRQQGLDRALPAITPRYADDADLLLAHTPRHIADIRRIASHGGGMLDADTIVSPHSDGVARLAVGGALAAVDAVLAEPLEGADADAGATRERPTTAFLLARPPGHHAMADRGMGFCLYNTVAVAARYAQQRYGPRRVLVLDWDVHHGNGTQSVFDADPSVLFISLHQYPLWPPGWGWLDQVGTGAGAGYTVNVPLPPGEGDAAYALACDAVVGPIARAFRPELVLVSAGQDNHVADPIGGMNVSADGFAALTRLARTIAASSGAAGPVLVLEGGYNPRTLPYLVGAILDALGDLGSPVTDPYARPVPISDDARQRIAAVRDAQREWWPV